MIVEATEDRILHVLRNTQQIERDGLEAVLWGGFNPERYAESLMHSPMRYCKLAKDGEPVVVGGLYYKTPAVAGSWMYGTDRWDEVVIDVTRATRRAIKSMLEGDARRVEVYSISTHDVAHRWYERALGMKHEAVLEQYGVNGETFYIHSKVRENG